MLKVITKGNCHQLNTFEQIQSEFLFKDGQNFLSNQAIILAEVSRRGRGQFRK